MELIPVIDLLAGQAVHARRGRREEYRPVESVLLPGCPGHALALARACRALPDVRHCYVADLDAIQRGPRQENLVRRLASPEGFGHGVWLDAGFTDADSLAPGSWPGIAALVVGMETVSGLGALSGMVEAAGTTPVLFSLDLRGGHPVRSGWGSSPEQIAGVAAGAGARGVIVLDLESVGSEAGPANLDLVARLKRSLSCPVYHGGGVRGPADLALLEAAGCDGALVGTAVHQDRLGPAYRPTVSR